MNATPRGGTGIYVDGSYRDELVHYAEIDGKVGDGAAAVMAQQRHQSFVQRIHV